MARWREVALAQPVLADFSVISAAAAKNPLRSIIDVVRQMGIVGAVRVALWSLRLLRPVSSMASERYFGLLPLTIGPHAAKFKWEPRQQRRRWPRLPWRRDSLRQDLRQRLAQGDLRFDLMVQFYVDEQRTPIERGAYAWKESDAPFVKVGELTIRSQDLGSGKGKELEDELRRTSFNPWNGIEAHRPLGNTQRGRRSVYQASMALRREDNGQP